MSNKRKIHDISDKTRVSQLKCFFRQQPPTPYLSKTEIETQTVAAVCCANSSPWRNWDDATVNKGRLLSFSFAKCDSACDTHLKQHDVKIREI